jgi:hypothetical protein
LAEPGLLAYVTQYIDPSLEKPLDLEAFADGILLITLAPPHLVGAGTWETAMEFCLRSAAEWRLVQADQNRDATSPAMESAMEEAATVTSRFFRSGDWRWDFEHDMPVDQQGRPVSGQVATAITPSGSTALAGGIALAPEIGPESPSGSPRPDGGRDILRMVASGQGTMLTPSEGAASADGAALAPELGSSWRWTASGPTRSPRSRQSPSASRLAGDGVFQTRADPTLQLDALAQLLQLIALAQLGSETDILSEQRPMPDCEDAYVASIVQMHAAAWPGEPLPAEFATAGTWFERWTLGCEDTRWPYAVAFMPDPKGGTTLSATLME